MAFLTGWVTNIILFILLAIVIDLLLPSSSMQKYAKVVIGLLLITVILTPVFKFFSKDVNQVIREFQFQSASGEDPVKSSLEVQKKEIQASERAYILEQMAVQMKKMAQKELIKNYGTEIAAISLTAAGDAEKIQSEKDVEKAEVIVKEEEKAVPAIQMIDIETHQTKKTAETADEAKIQDVIRFLSKTWQLDQKKITVRMEGGSTARNE